MCDCLARSRDARSDVRANDIAFSPSFSNRSLCRACFVTMPIYIVNAQVGSKGLEIKVDNPESYNFRPKEMLREICTTISQFSTQPGFHKVRPEPSPPASFWLSLDSFSPPTLDLPRVHSMTLL